MTRLHLRSAAAAALVAALFAAPAAAQSALASRGLGFQIDPLDGRARGLGGVTTGLAEPQPSLVNPASAAGLSAYAVVVAMEPDRYDATAGSVTTRGTTVRFPLILGYLPVTQRLGLQVGYGSYLDQHWAVQQSDSMTLSTGRVGVTDRFASSGGIARFQAGAAYRLTSRLSVGAAADVFTGAVHDSTLRRITGLNDAATELVYTYSGVGFGAGARFQPGDRFSVSAAVHGGGRIRAKSDSAGTETKDYTNPLSVDGGASARIGAATTVVASARWAGWSTVNDALAGSGGARDLTGFAGGVEYGGLRAFNKEIPLRVGGHYTQLPFRWSGAAAFPTERAVSAGLGYGFGRGTAMFDAAAERGTRGGSGAGIDEPYWRFSFSLRLLGR
jgi:hypothetical protein